MKKLLQKKTLNSRNLVGLNNQELRQYVIAGMTKKQRKIWNKLTPKEQEKLLKQVEKRVAAKLSGRNGVRDAKSVKTGRLQKTGKNQPSSGRNNKGHPVGKRRSKSNPSGQARAKQNSISVKRSMDGITSRQIKTVRTVPTVKKAAFNQRAGIPVSAVQKQSRYRNHGFRLDLETGVNAQPGQSIPLKQTNTQRGNVRPSQNVIIHSPDHVSKNSNHNCNTDGHYSAAYNSGKAKSKKEYEKQFNKQLKKISKKEGKLYKAEFARSLNAEIQKITGKEKAQSDKQREKTFEEMSAKGGRASIRLATMPFAFPLKMKAEKMIAAIAAAIGSVVT
ncbi:MAG: hypothetical protein Q4B26_04205 [Eubacteriales bacterium]|nr:hypothetical protein [Eubacteriales bacterium]